MIGSEKVFTGEYNHSVDAKNRMFLPAALRYELGEEIILTKGVDACIAVYPIEAWAVYTEKLNSLPDIQARKVKRFIYSSATKAQTDGQGRILISQKLKEFAAIEKNVVVVGVGDHVEIWNEDKWNEANDMNSDEMVETLISLGF